MVENQSYFLKAVSGNVGVQELALFPLKAEDDYLAQQKAFTIVDNRPEYDGAGLYRRDLGTGVNVYLGRVTRGRG